MQAAAGFPFAGVENGDGISPSDSPSGLAGSCHKTHKSPGVQQKLQGDQEVYLWQPNARTPRGPTPPEALVFIASRFVTALRAQREHHNTEGNIKGPITI